MATYRWALTGTNRGMVTLTVYVSATDKWQAVDKAFDSMGLVCIASCRKVSSKPLKG